LGGFGRFARGLKKNKKSKPKLNAKKKENSAGAAGLAAWRWALGKENVGQKWNTKFSTPLHPSVGRGRRIAER